MMRSGKLTLVTVIVTASCGIGIVAGDLAFASVPDSNGIIHACYTTSSGALRIIDPGNGGSCYEYETSLTWSSDGPKAFTGTATTTGNGDYGTLSETCPDGGVPTELWIDGSNPLSISGSGNQGYESLIYPNGDSTQPPDGISGGGTSVPKNTQVSYTLICS